MLVLLLNLAGRLRVLYWLWVCHKWYLLCWDRIPLYSLWWEFSFLMNRYWILSTPISVSVEMIMWFDFHPSFCHCDVSHYWFVSVEPSLWPWNNSKMIMVYDPFICCWIQFANILLKIFLHLYRKALNVLLFLVMLIYTKACVWFCELYI